MTALLQRARTGRGCLVEIAMVEAVFPALATAIDQYHRAGQKVPGRTGNAFANFNRAPYNVYEARDGHVAIILVTEAQWRNLLRAMGRDDLADDPRFINNQARVAHYQETDALVRGWTRLHTRADIFQATSRFKVPCAPVRDLQEMLDDPHMHQRGMLEIVDHYDYGPVVLPNSPLRFHGTDKVETKLSPRVGEHNDEIYGGWLGLSGAEITRLRATGVI